MTSGKSHANGPKDPAGSHSPSEPVFLVVGRLRRAHGVRGEIQMDVLTDFPERIQPGIVLYAGPQRQMLKVGSVRWHNQAMLIAFEEYRTPEAASELRNHWVSVTAADRPALEEDEYYHHQVLGLRVVEEDGTPLGTVTEILETGANDVYVIRPDLGSEIGVETGPGRKPALGHDLLLPATEETILKVDLEKGEMRVHVLPGLFD